MTTDSAIAAYVSMQPIYHDALHVFGYELLFRNNATSESAVIVDGDRATAQVILNLIEFGLDQIVGPDPAFINLTRNFILDGHCRSLPQDRVVLEVLEDVTADPDIVRALKKLAGEGYTIALDDFEYDDSLRPLVELADIVKLDILATDRERLKEMVPLLRGFGVKLLAEKVETQDDLAFCSELGFDYFQGFFFCEPKLIQGKQVPVNRLSATRLVAKLQDPDIKGEELDKTIRQDVTLSYKLLRFVNSAYCSLPRKVESMGHAAMMIGTQRIRVWASLLMMATMDDKPRELMMTAIIRAKMCEEIAIAKRLQRSEAFFTAGLFSVLDAMLDSTMEDVLKLLPVSEEIAQALVGEGRVGQVLDFTLGYERSDWDRLAELTDELGLDPATIRNAYLGAVQWAMEITNELHI